MVPPHWITANDLKEWPTQTNRQAQEKLPELLRRLVHATVQQSRKVDFPAGDSIQMGGWDGIVEILEGNSFIPDGYSGWEMGVDRDVKKKANGDYQKRCTDPLGLSLAETTFIFVTPRKWKNKKAWEQEKNNEGIWAEVRAYDADDLEQWLELAPTVHTWFARLIGKWTEDAQDLENFWQEWSSATEPVLIPQLYLASREQAVERVQNWLAASPSKLTVQADSKEEAIAFFAAAVLQLPEELRETYLSKCVILENRSSWQNFSSSENPLILIPKFEQLEFSPEEHYVLIPIGREFPSQNALQLDRPDRTALQQALVEMGLSRHRADTLLKESRRNLFVLRHLLTVAPEIHSPNWAKLENVRPLIPALLAGAWDDTKESDRNVISQLANKPYTEVESDLTQWINSSDPPIRKIGNAWQVVSRNVAWHFLSGFIIPSDLERLKNSALTVLGTSDPRYELPAEQRLSAWVYDKVLPHSDLLRQGLAETLAVLAARGLPRATQDIRSAQGRVDEIVDHLLKVDADWQRWASLADLLPTLAEAAPDVFLSTIEAGFAGDQPPVLQLFLEKERYCGGRPYRALEALEALAWEPQYLCRVALILAKLARLEPADRVTNRSNRPLSSLREIFLCWHPHTLATLEERLQVLDTLLRREPQVTWKLLCDLLPEFRGDVSDLTYKPRWRDWDTDYAPQITYAEYWKGIDAVMNRLLSNAGNDCERLSDLIKCVDDLPAKWRDRIIDYLDTVDITSSQFADLTKLCNSLRKIVYSHRKFPDAEWAMPVEIVDRLYKLYQKFEPKDSIYRYAWLFSFNPSLLEDIERDWRLRDQRVRQVQTQVAEAIYSHDGVALLLDVANYVVAPRSFGAAIARIEKIAEGETELLNATLGQANEVFRELAIAFVQNRWEIVGWNWVKRTIAFGKQEEWFAQQTVNFFFGLPLNQCTWNLLDSFEEDTKNLYWRTIPVDSVSHDSCEAAVRKLLEVNRPHAALNLVSLHMGDGRSMPLPSDLLIEILEKLIDVTPETETPQPENLHLVPHEIENIFYELDRLNIEDSEIACLEWMYLPILRYEERQPKILHRELARNPLFFAEILKFIYLTEDDQDESREPDKETVVRARLGHELLESWHQIPGSTEKVTVDPEELRAWISKARTACYASGRGKIGDHHIGKILAHVPKMADEIWTDAAIREIVEEVASEDLIRGIEIGIRNKHGVWIKLADEGGSQERQFAETYRNDAKTLQTTYPRIAPMLQRIGRSYDFDAHREDIRVELQD